MIVNVYRDQELEFTKQVRRVLICNVPHDANIISSHVFYKVKKNDDHSLKIKAQTAPHGNEERIRNELRTECCMYSLTGIRIILSLATLHKWRLSKVDVKSAFL